MHTKQINEKIFQIDLQTGGYKNLISSYLIKTNKPTIIETGPTTSVPKLLLGLKELKMKTKDIEFVAITHVHTDHGGGAGTLLRSLPNAKVIVHPRGMPHLVNPEKLWLQTQAVLGYVSEIFGEPEPVPQDKIISTVNGVFDLGSGVELKAVETLGHASHNLSFYETLSGGIFPGDVAGIFLPEFDAVIPTSPSPFYLDSALASLDKLIRLKPSVLYYSHFGIASDAVRRLVDYKLRLLLWGKIAEEGVLKEQSFEVICNRILAEDKVMSKLADYLKSHPVYSKTALGNSIQGFIDNAKRTHA